MSLLILDVETVPRPSIDDEVEIEITKKTKVRVEQTGDNPENAESLIRSTSPFLGKSYVLDFGFCLMLDKSEIR